MPVARNGNVVAPPPTNGFNHYTPAQSQAPPPPGNNYPPTANMTQMPPSSTLYQTQSWDHKPPPAMPSNMPPSKPAAPVTPGWNDPPPMTLKQTAPAQPVKQNVMEISWKPMDMAPAPGGMMAPSRPMNGGNLMQSLSLQNAPSSTASSSYPSPASQATSAPAPAPPPIQLSPDDEKIMEPINNLAAQIIETARVQAKIGKATELRARIQAELPPRLAANRLSAATKHHLTNMAYFL
uniref:Uncharacterized protein n=1 Tax=Caenorhabditis japonica TaxID=281687 RepID=A0A8R1IKV3_CAEJA